MLKPIPDADPESQPFWDGCREHRYRIQLCDDCKTPRYPPTRHCPACRSTNSHWIDSSGQGSVHSWIVVRHPIPREVYGDEVPYVVALIDLKEGVRVASNIIGCEPSAVRADMPVSVVFEAVRDGVVLPKFRPA